MTLSVITLEPRNASRLRIALQAGLAYTVPIVPPRASRGLPGDNLLISTSNIRHSTRATPRLLAPSHSGKTRPPRQENPQAPRSRPPRTPAQAGAVRARRPHPTANCILQLQPHHPTYSHLQPLKKSRGQTLQQRDACCCCCCLCSDGPARCPLRQWRAAPPRRRSWSCPRPAR
jgi:hypothetical protein